MSLWERLVRFLRRRPRPGSPGSIVASRDGRTLYVIQADGSLRAVKAQRLRRAIRARKGTA